MFMLILLVPAVLLAVLLGMDRLEHWAVDGTEDQAPPGDGSTGSA